MRTCLIAFCLGIWLLQQQAVLPPARWLWLLPLLSTALLLPQFAHPLARYLRRAALAVLCLALGVSWATWRADLRLAERLPDQWQGVDIELVGVVSALPQTNARGERFMLDVDEVLTPGAPRLSRVQLARYWPDTGDREATVHAGERWRFTVRLKIPYGTHNPQGFDLEGWMLEQGINATGYVREHPPPERLKAPAPDIRGWLAATRERLRDRIFARLGEAPYAGVIAALVIGDQRGIPSW